MNRTHAFRAGRAAEHVRHGYRRLTPRFGPTAAQRRETRRRRAAGFTAVGLLGLAGALLQRRAAHQADTLDDVEPDTTRPS
ncbi:hypothetical protein ABT095_14140 [Kitasatospora sp. NPDC002227]|uniref:hypothetical protein n=1 Tax=Kitasatospora sp. NPDC002227 TaxID=3154773 RepID=UPI00332FB6A8